MPEKPYIFVVTGPESTGKTTLAADLALYFHGTWIPEYARSYVSALDRAYTFDDVEKIARHQIGLLPPKKEYKGNYLFMDTDLIILKVWFREVYRKVPSWLEEEIGRRPVSGYLLCATDLPWLPDPVRENPGQKREYLFHKYREELQKYGLIYRIVTGMGPDRTQRAVQFIREITEEISGR